MAENLVYVTFLICAIIALAFYNIGDGCSGISRLELEAHFATKTPYRAIANKTDNEIIYKDCKPQRIWTIIRHGTRNPGKKEIRNAKDRLSKIRDEIINSDRHKLCPHQLEDLRTWKFDVLEHEEKFLAPEGEDELLELGERYQKRFPTLFPENYDHIVYKFQYTDTQRTHKSARQFAAGLFGRHRIGEIIYPNPLRQDPVLRFYKKCPRWTLEVDSNPDTYKEALLFSEGDTMKKSIGKISKTAGVSGLNFFDVQLMYTICAFETSWNKNKISPWCSLFDETSLQTLEFAEDLKYYWNDGYGYDLNHKQACPAIIDLIDHIKPSSILPNTTAYFTHSGTILKLLSHLNLYRDDFKLTHKDFTTERKWRVSQIDAFGTNIAFVLFSCQTGPKVLTLHQENIIHLPGCPQNNDLCDFKTFEDIFKDSTENCNFSKLCKLD